MSRELIRLSDHFTFGKLIRYALPPISTMIFTSLYGIVDGYFVSNHAGGTAFASLNLVMPFIMLIAGVGFMFGSGGSALVAFYLGMKKTEQANRAFSMIVYTVAAVGAILGMLGFVLAEPASRMLGASDAMLPYCVTYLRINMAGVAFFMLQQLFQSFLITAERPQLGLCITLIAGCTNMVLDWLLVGILRCGLAGAAWATVLSQIVGSVIPFLYFLFNRSTLLRLGKASFELSVIAKACGNGISECLSNVSTSIVGFLYNLQLMKYAGEQGVAAYGVIMYVSFIFVAVYIGYTMGVSPTVSYHDGARNQDELKSLYRKSLFLLTVANIAMTILAEAAAVPLSKMFVGYQPSLHQLTVRGLRIYAIAFLVMGYNVFSSAFFTALNNGAVSAVLSVSRTLVLQLVMIALLPFLFGLDGLWAVPTAVEGFGFILSIICLIKYGRRYGYR